MKILFLGPPCEDILNFLSSSGDEVTTVEESLSEHSLCLEDKDFLISYKYRHLLNRGIIDKFPKKAVNLHISLLPWNRGADPNIWSFLEDTPKGVSIHYMTYGLDKGDVLAQREVSYLSHDTLRTTYQRLLDSIEGLFKDVWKDIRTGKLTPRPQPPSGSYHRKNDLMKFRHLLTHGWDTPVTDLIGKAVIKAKRNGDDAKKH